MHVGCARSAETPLEVRHVLPVSHREASAGRESTGLRLAPRFVSRERDGGAALPARIDVTRDHRGSA